MLNQEDISQLDRLFPALTGLAPATRDEIFAAGQIIRLPAGQMLMQQNQQCRYVPLVLSGILRVFKVSAGGREITLFRTGPGDTCLVSIACQLRCEDFPALAEVEEEATLFMLPTASYHKLLDGQAAWKDFLVSTLYGHLLTSLEILEAVAFDRTDKRLITWLWDKCGGHQAEIRTTHEAVAIELGTAREVISRLLGDLRERGVVSLGRGRIKIINPDALRTLNET